MKISEVLKTKGQKMVTMTDDQPAKKAVELMIEEKIGGIIVCDSAGQVAGVLSERDIVYGLAEHGEAVLSIDVRDLLSGDVHTCTSQDTMFKAMSMMTDRRVRHIPVIEEGQLGGIISVGDVVKARIEEIENEAEALREYINTA